LLAARVTLMDNVVVAALTIAALDDEIAATQRIAAADNKALAVAHDRERLGATPQTDVLRARSTLAATEASLPDLEKALAAARSRLAVLEGKTPQDFEPPDFSLADFTLPQQLPVSLPSSLVHQRPDILAAEADLHVASAAVGVATANLYPQITLSASYGRQSNVANDLFDPPAEIWSIGGSLLYPLFHGNELHNQRAAAVSQFDAVYADYCQTVLSAFAQVGDVLAALEQDAQALRARNAALRSAHASYSVVAAQYRAGAADYTDLLSTESAWQSALVAQLQARADRLQDTVALYQALGGGWWNAADQTHDSTTAAAPVAQQE
jgi:NodT family efflux transporter outer membrane factor (OMF) lipoprotein